MIISLIVAASENNVIGKHNKLPWHLPADLKYFKNTTWAMPVVMGRKTFESIGKPLPGRMNIVITRNPDWKADGVKVVNNFEQAVVDAGYYNVKEIFIIGGAQLFNSLLPSAEKIYLTRIHHNFDGDVFLPVIDKTNWEMISNRYCEPDERNIYPYSFQVWGKIHKA